ncbi:hypothetical protein AB9K26_11205 [Psychroserpens sp. XS_ASV72]|uniref:hypothetical protein n=1 Tax=Psychroserpens sp. XS_ASV72 TaxID=3241293 RepID=UPI003513BE51
MKQVITLALCCLLSLSSLAQSDKTIIQNHVETYFEYMTNQNFDGVLDYMYPKVFDMAPRSQMKLGMEQMFNAEGMKIAFLSNDVTNVSDLIDFEGKNYALINYNSKMKMTFLSEQNQPEEDQKGFLTFMKATMETQFGEGNVTDELETMSLIVNMDATMYAIKDPNYEGWKLLGNDDAMKTLVDTIIPEEVKSKVQNEKE